MLSPPKQEFRSLHAKVTAIRELQKESEQLNVSQLKVMVTWYRRVGDLPAPSRRNLLIERLNSTRCRSDPVEPTVPDARIDVANDDEVQACHATEAVENERAEPPAAEELNGVHY
jgi:hypothetical protein